MDIGKRKVKEIGSDYNFEPHVFTSKAEFSFESTGSTGFYFSGRAALYAIVQLGVEMYHWKAVYLPEYYCHNVDNFINDLPIKVCYYDDGPYYENINEPHFKELDKLGNAIVIVNFFGTRNQPDIDLKEAMLIEDHTHGLDTLWIKNSRADFCFASLRKVLPVPAGGALWSPKKRHIPTPPDLTEAAGQMVDMKFAAMVLKTSYLEGNGKFLKDIFRKLYADSEAGFANKKSNSLLPDYVIDLIHKVDLKELNKIKRANYDYLLQNIDHKDVCLDLNSDNELPIGFFIYCNTSIVAAELKAQLVSNDIYPAVLWPEQITVKARSFSEKILMIHCDYRYSKNDMKQVASLINKFFDEYPDYIIK